MLVHCVLPSPFHVSSSRTSSSPLLLPLLSNIPHPLFHSIPFHSIPHHTISHTHKHTIDLNMPKVDTYGTQQPIALLHFLIGRGNLYDRGKDLHVKVTRSTLLLFSSYCLVLSCLVLSCLVLSCLVLSCLVLSCPVLSCLVLSCLVLSCPVLSCLFVLFVIMHLYSIACLPPLIFEQSLSPSPSLSLSLSLSLSYSYNSHYHYHYHYLYHHHYSHNSHDFYFYFCFQSHSSAFNNYTHTYTLRVCRKVPEGHTVYRSDGSPRWRQEPCRYTVHRTVQCAEYQPSHGRCLEQVDDVVTWMNVLITTVILFYLML